MTKNNIGAFLMYPVFRLGDSPLTRKLHRAHELVLHGSKIAAVALPAFTALYLFAGFYLPSSVSFSPSDNSCVFAPSVAPHLLKYQTNDFYTITTPPRVTFMGKNLFSTHMCVVPTSVASSSQTTIKVSQLNLPFQKTFTVKNSALLSAEPILKSDAISTRNNLVFSLSEPDMFFDYVLVADGRSVECHVQADTVVCPTKELELEQGAEYEFQLKQALNGSSQSLFSEELTTITSVDITASSIVDGSTVYDQPTGLVLTASKSLAKVGIVRLSDGEADTGTTATVTDTTISVVWETPLLRQKAYSLSIDSVEAEDGGHLEKPYVLTFTTSGGPKVIESSLPSVRTSQYPDFTLTFDQPLKGDQDFSQIIGVSSGGTAIPLTITANGNQLRIRARGAVNACSDYLVSIKETLTSIHGINGGNIYTSTHRTQCAREFSIGTSLDGRAIVGYALGNGPKKVLFLGALHGNEKSGYYLLSSWLDYLEANPAQIPADKTIIILPKLNPDGFSRNSRFNARNVDLNRNFASASWKSDVVVPGGQVQMGAGGTAPLSEPESRQLVDYILSIQPTLIMSYHSQGSITIPNGSGNSNALAYDYARAVGYRYISAEASATAFPHETTGALEDWLNEVPNIPVVLNELSSHGATGLFQFHREPILKVIKQ